MVSVNFTRRCAAVLAASLGVAGAASAQEGIAPMAGALPGAVTVGPIQAGPGTAPVGAMAAREEMSPFARALAGAVADEPAIAQFYRNDRYEAIWTDPEPDDRARVSALVVAFEQAETHALPVARFSPRDIQVALGSIETESDRARAEAELSRRFLAYANAVQSGVLESNEVVGAIKRKPPRRDGTKLLTRLAEEQPTKVMRALPPASPEYANLLRARVDLARTVSDGGWGETVPEGKYELGSSGAGVVGLRNRLIAMGYMQRTALDGFDGTMDAAVRHFQEDHGLAVDGVVGGATLAEINLSAEDRLGQVVVAMERERWLNLDRGRRHIWVNLADFTAKIIDDGQVTFETRAVVGSPAADRQSPEFSDQMEHLIVNPSWHVPRSIAVKEYLPSFRNNPYANGHLTIYYKGEAVARDRINWPVVTAANWPFELKQAPSRSNALGLVKFMFPNQWDIYLHDTPQKDLFNRSARAFSHGCIRLQDPFDFAYALLARQSDDPEALFHARLDSGRETRLDLETPVPVHLVYRTAFTTPKGELRFRPDIYGRDRAILTALEEAGVVIADLPS